MNTTPDETHLGFSPPTAEQLAEHIAEHAPRMWPAWVRYVPPGVIGGAVGVSLLWSTAWSLLLPWLALGGVVIFNAQRRRLLQQRAKRAQWTQELAMLRHYRAALRSAWSLLPQLRTQPDEHGRIIAVMGHVLEDLGQHDAANEAFEYLLQGLPDAHPGAVSLRVQQAIASFQAGHLADGDAHLRKVRGAVGPFEDGPLGAAYHAARLVQSVATNHFAEGIEDVADPVATFRPLGIDGGFAHALRAYCLHRLDRRKEAATAWRRATLLLPADELRRRLPVLHELGGGQA